MSPAKKAAAKKRLARFRFQKGGGKPASSGKAASSGSRGGGSTGENKKRKKVEPIPVVGVRGSSTKISLAKTAGVVTGASLAVVPSATGQSALDGLTDPVLTSSQKFTAASDRVMERAGEIWAKHGTKILIGGGLALIFGRSFDRKHPDFPIRLGK